MCVYGAIGSETGEDLQRATITETLPTWNRVGLHLPSAYHGSVFLDYFYTVETPYPSRLLGNLFVRQ